MPISPKLTVVFFMTPSGNEPVREWLIGLNKRDKKTLGEDIKTVQFGWPLGMPLVEKLEPDLWEVRSHLSNGIARVLFTVVDNQICLLHGLIKKTNKLPLEDLELARSRRNAVRAK